MGHSFFKPVALNMPSVTAAAGVSHSQDTVFSGGSSGAPLALWNSSKSDEIKAYLDAGNVELFGMTFEGTYPTTEGYKLWFDYAISSNSAVDTFMIGLPWLDFPTDYDTSNYTSTYRAQVQTLWPTLLAELRREYPNVTIMDVPYGLGVVELRLLLDEGALAADVSAMTGDKANALYVDHKGHGGDIVHDLSSLIWLNRVYGVDLSTLTLDKVGFGGYTVDLIAIANAVLRAYDEGSTCGSDACTAVTWPVQPPADADDDDGGGGGGGGEPCTDSDVQIVRRAEQAGIPGISSCADASGYCSHEQYGAAMRQACACTCSPARQDNVEASGLSSFAYLGIAAGGAGIVLTLVGLYICRRHLRRRSAVQGGPAAYPAPNKAVPTPVV